MSSGTRNGMHRMGIMCRESMAFAWLLLCTMVACSVHAQESGSIQESLEPVAIYLPDCTSAKSEFFGATEASYERQACSSLTVSLMTSLGASTQARIIPYDVDRQRKSKAEPFDPALERGFSPKYRLVIEMPVAVRDQYGGKLNAHGSLFRVDREKRLARLFFTYRAQPGAAGQEWASLVAQGIQAPECARRTIRPMLTPWRKEEILACDGFTRRAP